MASRECHTCDFSNTDFLCGGAPGVLVQKPCSGEGRIAQVVGQSVFLDFRVAGIFRIRDIGVCRCQLSLRRGSVSGW